MKINNKKSAYTHSKSPGKKKNRPNPAFLNNHCYSYVWFDCELKQKQDLDIHEDIEVIKVPLSEIKEYITSGKIDHSLVLTAFFFYGLKYKDLEF